MSNLMLYMIGFVFLIGGLAWGASLLGVPPTWIGVGCIILVGMAIISGVNNTRYRETSPSDPNANRVVVED